MLNIAELEKIGLVTEEGLAYCADDPEFYEEMLGEYLEESRVRMEEMQSFLISNNWSQYAICAHSLKNTSRMIGAVQVSELARELELAGKEEKKDLILEKHDPFIQTCTDLTDRLRNIIQ